ncbi:MAG: ankyrin repeat domain-containing protein [Bacteroidales bacterium]
MRKIFNYSIILFTLFFYPGYSQKLFSQDIISAVNKGNLEELNAFLAKGVDPNTKARKETILAVSINDKYPEIVKALLNAKGIRINEWNIQSMPELSWKYVAVMRAIDHPEILKLFLEKGPLLDLQDDQITWDGKLHESGGNTALLLAVREIDPKYTESAKLLIDKGAKVDIQNKLGYTALMLAVHKTDIVNMLLAKNAKIDLQSKGGETALMLAAGKHTEVVKILLDKKANIQLRQSTIYKSSRNALDFAAQYGNLEAAKLIMARAVELGIKDEIIRNSLHYAVLTDQVEMAKYLLDEGALVEGSDQDGNFTPLMETSHLPMVQLLIARGANVNAKNKFNYTPLHKAVSNFMVAKPKEKDCEKIMNILIEKGADINAQDGNGNTPLMYAVQRITPAKILVAKGADVNIQNKNGETALMFAVKGGLIKAILGMIPVVGGSVDAVNLLVSKGADLNIADKWGKTALMHAASGVNALGDRYSTYTEILGILIAKGAQIEAQDKEGNTALYWAQRYNRTKSADLLLAKGANPAKKYDKSLDKSNIAAGIVGIWEKYLKVEGVTYTTRVVLKADWSYSKAFKDPKTGWIPDGGGYTSYELRDGRIWLFNNITPAVVEWRFEGKDLVMNGEKYIKVLK